MSVEAYDYDALGDRLGPIVQRNAKRLAKGFAAGFRPPPRVLVSEWAAKYRRFGEDAPLPGPWRNEVAPYLVEIMDRASPFDSCSMIAIMKCSQSGGSAAGENFIGYCADISPGPVMFVQATMPAALDWARNKLWPMINATPRLNPKRKGAIKAAGEGSTKTQVDFARGGFLILAGANSAATLTQKTVRYAIEDDIDQFPDDLDGQGSPEAMVTSRLKFFRFLGLSKRIKIGTPTVLGASKIAAAYGQSDRRKIYLKCPGCGGRFHPVWEQGEGGARDIQWPEGRPDLAYLVAPCCGAVIEDWQKVSTIRFDCWCPTVEIDGQKPPRHMTEEEFQVWRARDIGSLDPGYHIGGLVTAFDSWGELARKYCEAQGDQNKLKGWVMLDLGEPFEVRGEAPDHERLKSLVEQDWGAGRRVPFGVLATTMGVDVQADGVYYEILGWGRDSASWAVEAGFVPGQTDVEGEGAWADLDALVKRGVVYPGGQTLPIDQVCVDAGFHTKAAEHFCRRHANRLAVFGRAGWRLPILGRGEASRYETQGKRTGQASRSPEDRAYLVGTFGVKLTFYGYLRKSLEAHEAELKGERLSGLGRCRFGAGLPTDYFEQLTAETIETRVVNGFPRREWRPIKSRPNHYLDCRVYNHAAAEKQKLDTLTEVDWAALQRDRYAEKPGQADLFDGPSLTAQPASPPAAVEPANAVRVVPPQSWIQPESAWI